MNPSRISTQVCKSIDTWHFKFNGKVIEFVVSMRRPRDAQTKDSKEPPNVYFEAQTTSAGFDRWKVTTGEFAHVTFRDSDINKLREECEKHVQCVLKLQWRKVLIVGFQPKVGNEGGQTTEESANYRTHDPAIDMKYDFAVGMESVPPLYYRQEAELDETGYMNKDATRLLSGYFEKEYVRVFDYTEALHATFRRIKESYSELNARVASFIEPGCIDQLQHAFPALPGPSKPDLAAVGV